MSDKKQTWFFLRGLVRESGHWAGFLESFGTAFPHRRAVALDIPGAGRRFREQSPTTVKEIAAAVRGEFLGKKGEENYLFALSLGAMVGVQWMSDFPDDLAGAVLANTSLRGLSPFYHRLQPANYGRILQMFLRPRDLAFRERQILEMTSHREERFAELEKEWTAIQAERPVSRKNSLRQVWAAARFYPPEEKPRAKVLLLNGDGDRLVSPLCSQALARHWRAPLLIHPSAGHDITLDEPGWVIEQLKNF